MIDPKLIEPKAAEVLEMSRDENQAVQYSMAISLKRIADKLDGDIFTQPVNHYGESFTDALQMAFVRGQRGIDVI